MRCTWRQAKGIRISCFWRQTQTLTLSVIKPATTNTMNTINEHELTGILGGDVQPLLPAPPAYTPPVPAPAIDYTPRDLTPRHVDS